MTNLKPTQQNTPAKKKKFFQKTSFIYSQIFGAIGIIFGYFLALAISSLFAGYIGMKIYQGGEIPEPVGFAFMIFFFTLYLFFVFFAGYQGVRYGKKIEHEANQKEIYKKAQGHLVIVFLMLLGFAFYIFNAQKKIDRSLRQANPEVVIEIKEYGIAALELIQQGKNLRVLGEVHGELEEEYELNMLIIGTTAFKQMILSRHQSMKLKSLTEKFEFMITFDELAGAYRDQLAASGGSLEINSEFDETLSIQAVLVPRKIAQNQQFTEAFMQSNVLQKMTIFANFYFSCQVDYCQVIQKTVP
jgi:hypothetical protein